jgi:hypothetical protein
MKIGFHAMCLVAACTHGMDTQTQNLFSPHAVLAFYTNHTTHKQGDGYADAGTYVQDVAGDTTAIFGKGVNTAAKKAVKKKSTHVRPQQQAVARLIPVIRMYARASDHQARTLSCMQFHN